MLEVCLDIETSGLLDEDPFISAIGVSSNSGVRIFADPDEKELMRQFLEYYAVLLDIARQKKEELVFITYNGEHFDFPLLQKRIQHYHPFFLDFGLLLEKQKQIDLMPVARKNLVNFGKDIDANTRYISKDQSCSKMGIYVPNTIDGGECARIAKRRRYSDEHLPDPEKTAEVRLREMALLEFQGVLAHNAIDLYATASLYSKMKRSGWI